MLMLNKSGSIQGLIFRRGIECSFTGRCSPVEALHLPRRRICRFRRVRPERCLRSCNRKRKPVVASPDAQLPVIGSSHLYLGVNGGQCTGKLAARVHVEKPQPGSRPR